MCNSSCLWEFYLAYGPSKAPTITELYIFNRGDTKYHGGLQSRELCQAPIMQALSSHMRV